MLIVALTGGIASGKSIVAEVLDDLGCYIYYADKVSHELMTPKKKAWKKIVAHFGDKILNKDKTINRAKLGSIVYADAKKRQFLNELMHPLVFKKREETINNLKKERKYKIFISEAALTIEAGHADFYDKIIMVYCQKEVQIKRLMLRDHINHNEALKKIKSQMESEEKLKYADYIIDSSGSIESTVEQTEQVFRNLMMDYELKCESVSSKQ